MTRGIAVVGVVLLALLSADLAATAVAERRAGAALCGADVELGPWPVVLRLVTSRPVAFTATLDADDVARVTPLPALVEDVTVADGQVRLATTTGLTVPAEVILEPDAVVVTPRVGPVDLPRFAVRLDLDDLPAGIELASVEVTDDHVVASGHADPRRLPSGDGLACRGPGGR